MVKSSHLAQFQNLTFHTVLSNFLDWLPSWVWLCFNRGTKWYYLITCSTAHTKGLSKKIICASKKDLQSLAPAQHNKTHGITSSKSQDERLLLMKWTGGLILTLNKSVPEASEKSAAMHIDQHKAKGNILQLASSFINRAMAQKGLRKTIICFIL